MPLSSASLGLALPWLDVDARFVEELAPGALVEQERFFRDSESTDGDPPIVTLYEATDFSLFSAGGHQSSLSDEILTGDLRASGGASGPFPEVGSSARASFRVVFDLLAVGTFDLDARLESRDIYFFDLGAAEIVLSVFDSGLGDYEPVFSQQVSRDGGLAVVGERFQDLPAGRYQLEALATGNGFWGSQDVAITGSGNVQFAFTTPEPGSGVLLGTMLVLLAARRRAGWRP